MRIVLLLFLASVFVHTSMAQERIPVDLKSSQLRLNILSPGIEYEKSIGANTSVGLEFGLTTAICR